MNLKTYLLSMPILGREDFAKRCGTTYGHMRNVSYGKACAEELAIAIEKESSGVVTVSEMHAEFANLLRSAGYVRQPYPSEEIRPDVFGDSPETEKEAA